jgi:hypothetical protein
MTWNRSIAVIDRTSFILNVDPIEGATARHFIILNEGTPWQRSYLLEIDEADTKVIGCYKNRKSAKNAAQEYIKKTNPNFVPKKKARIKT